MAKAYVFPGHDKPFKLASMKLFYEDYFRSKGVDLSLGI